MTFLIKDSRPFNISCGLLPGYDVSQETQDIEKAKLCIGLWIVARLSEEKKIVVGTILAGDFIYPSIGGDVKYQTEKAFHYKGMVRDDTTEEEAKEILQDLAVMLSKSLKQKCVHVQYKDVYWIYESNY